LQDFDYVAAKSVDEVISLLSKSETPVRVLSGGTDLLVQLREGRKQAGLVVDIKRIAEVNDIVYDPEKGLTVGAAVPCLKLCHDPIVQKTYPGLVDAARLIGGVQIQGRATVGGNLCNASPAADSIPALIVHKAVCVIAGPGGVRELPVAQFCSGPGQNVMAKDEFLLAVRLPPLPAGFGAHYLRFIPRNEMDIAVVGAGASVVLNQQKDTFTEVHIALGAVAPIPLYTAEASEFLAGKAVSPENILEAARMAQSAVRPISDMRGTAEQRRHLSLILTKRALNGAVERARGLSGNGHSGNGHQ
jgi:CO/xanthine dehydrogenase FAD-binding subunit